MQLLQKIWSLGCNVQEEIERQKKNSTIKSVYIGDVTYKKGEKTPRILLECSFLNNNKFTKIKSVPDTGAEASICGPALIKKLKLRESDIKKKSENERLIAANGLPIKTIGKLRLQIRADENLIE